MTQPLSRAEKVRRAADQWFLSTVPWIGTAGMVVALVLNRPEFILPFAGLAGSPFIVVQQRKRNGQRNG